MTLKNFLPALAIGVVLGVASASITPAFSDDKRPATAAPTDQQWLSIPQIIHKLEAAGYRNIEKIEREHGSYEGRATNREGQRRKLYVHPQTGEVMDYRPGERYERGESDERGRGSADCNERRCRDDLPKAGAKVVPPAGK